MNCGTYREQFAEWLDGELGKDCEQLLEAHIAHCADCARSWNGFRHYERLVGDLPPATPPVDLADRIRQRVSTVSPIAAIRCSEIQPHLMLFIDEQLDPSQEERVLSHTLTCQSCQRELRLMEMQAQLLQAMPTVPAPADMKERILSAVHATQTKPATAPLWSRSLPVWRWIGGLSAVGACAGLLLGLTLGRLHQSPGTRTSHPDTIARASSHPTRKLGAPDAPAISDQVTREKVAESQGSLALRSEPRYLATGEPGATGALLKPTVKTSDPGRHRSIKAVDTNGKGRGSKTDKTLIAKSDSGRSSSDATEDTAWLPDDTESESIPETPLDLPAPVTTVHHKSEPEPSEAPQEVAPKRFIVLDTPSTNRRPLDDIRGQLAKRRHDPDYRIVEDRVPSKMLSVNVIRLKFD